MLKSKLLFTFLFIAVLCSTLYWAGSHYKYDLYEAAMAYEREQAGLTEKQLQVDDLTIAYLEGPRRAGEQSILLIHGFGAIKENWMRFAAQLTNRFHVVVIDLPGHGESTKDLSLNYGIEHQVEFVHQIAQTLGLGQFHIAGNSMGGAISALYAAKYPAEIKTATLYDPAGIHDVESDLEKHLREGDNPLIVSDTDSFHRLLKFAMEKPPFIPWPITEVAAEMASQKQKINAKIFTDISSGDRDLFKAEISKINTPTLIIWGTEDRVINVANADAFEKLITGSRKIILQGIGHVPMIEVPKESAELLEDFINNPA
ncbi:alpha/beta fold hydrolase [Alkalimarinus sediminis]|uniref:Alpha/beta hydrolase n=1 Tax=Alkalimarinus sediminis TaxID=1632866 RepID=A0A9E8HHP0_9ALTE|nr:alpha/beta hydrolase [Alkalimarinus sediminis]UZW74863.1 alpha/beta hydrolase [Alkalimarinus sediminis]